jgi:ribosome recycling factor
MSYQATIKDARERMDKSLHHLQDVLRTIRTSRASGALVEGIRVEYYGTPTPIAQIASISVPEPRQIMIKPFDASSLQDIAKAIMKSDLGIQPMNDGKVLRLTMPALSGEQRKKYASKVKELCEEARIAMRNARRDMNKHADTMLKSGELTEDENKKLHDEIQKLLKEHEDKITQVQDKKTAEIMEV